MPAISTRGLTRKFGDRIAVNNLTCDIECGEIFGFLGPNGAGKTTTIRMLTGLISPTSGTCTVAGYELGYDNHAIRNNVGLLTEVPGFYEKLTAEQNLLFFSQIYNISKSDARSRITHYLKMMDLSDRRTSKVSTFSKGMRQKLAIVRALIHDPQIIFLDEPTAGLDPEAAGMVRSVINLLKEEGRTIFLTSHNLHEVDMLCDRIAVFRERLLHLGTPEKLRKQTFGVQHIFEFEQDTSKWLSLIQALPCVQTISREGTQLIVSLHDPTQKPEVIKELITAGAQIQNVYDRKYSLEDVYLQLINESETSPTPKEALH